MAIVIRGVFDGKVARPLPSEPAPDIEGEVEVEIVLMRDKTQRSRQAIENLLRMRKRVSLPLRKLIEEGRRF